VTGKIDAFSAWEPTPFLTTENYPDTVVIHRSMSSGYMFFNRALYEKHPEAVRLIIAAKIRAFKWVYYTRDNLLTASRWSIDESRKISAKMSLLSEKETAALALDDVMGTMSLPFIPEFYISENGRINKEFTFLKRLGILSPAGAWKRVYESFDLRIIHDILALSSAYRLNDFDYEVSE
jgi:NitT/TauT family transport system substrate-binding protein